MERIRELRELLGNEDMVLELIKTELQEISERYGDERRTKIAPSEDDIDIEDLIADQQMVISITNSGYIKSLPLATYRAQRRGGVGIIGMDMKDEDFIEHLFVSSTHDYLLFFTNRGKVYRSKVYDLPEMSRTSKGRYLGNVLPLREGERVQSVLATRDFSRGAVPRVRHPQRHGQEDGVPGLQHADPGRRHHRHQHPRRRRARRRAAGRRGRRDPDGLARRPRRALQGVRRPRDGPRHQRRPRHGRRRQGQLRAGDGRRAARPGPAGRDRGRLRQAHARWTSTGSPHAAPRASRRSRSPRPRACCPARWSCASTRSSSSSPRTAWSSAPSVRGINRYGRASQGVKVMNLREGDRSRRSRWWSRPRRRPPRRCSTRSCRSRSPIEGDLADRAVSEDSRRGHPPEVEDES